MKKLSLDAVARERIARAHSESSGRSSETVYGGHEHSLRQVVMALTAGSVMAEHESPGEATLYVISGRVTVVAAENSWEVRTGDLLEIPAERHSVEALEDSCFLLTVVKTVSAS